MEQAASLPNVTESVTKNAQEVVATVAQKTQDIKRMLTGNTFVLTILVVGVIAAFVVAGALYFSISRNISPSKTLVLKETRKPLLCNTLTKADGGSIPSPVSGKRMTLSFWIYIHELNTNNGQIRRVFSRGTNKDVAGITSSVPFVALNDKSNKLHIVFPSSESSQYMQKGVDRAVEFASAPLAKKVEFLSTVHGITIDYVPMQRWVHVAVVVNEESDGGVISAYIDGELTKTVSNNSNITLDNKTLNLEIQNLELSTSGDVFIGGEQSSVPGFNGLVAQVGFTSTDMNAKDIYKLYLRGPLDNRMGIPSYGIQSPIYRIG